MKIIKNKILLRIFAFILIVLTLHFIVLGISSEEFIVVFYRDLMKTYFDINYKTVSLSNYYQYKYDLQYLLLLLACSVSFLY